MDKFNLVLEAFQAQAEKASVSQRARTEKLENAWSEANSMLPPILDCMGRFHAPADGYSLCEGFDFCNGVDPHKLYRKGEFLPIPLPTDEEGYTAKVNKSNRMMEKYAAREKLKIELDLAKKICENLEMSFYIEFSHGQSWEVNGVAVCYLYLKSYSHTLLKNFFIAIRDAIENTDKHVFTGQGYEGRCRVKGRIVSVRDEPQSIPVYPYETVNTKAFIILENDSTCFGNVSGYAKPGMDIEFTGTFTRSDKNEHHSYFKRPFKMILSDPNDKEE